MIKYRKIIFIVFVAIFNILCFEAFAAFIHPMDFNGSEAQKKQVIQNIRSSVKIDYCDKLKVCSASFLRRMEQKELDSFKLITKAENRKMLNNLMNTFCTKDSCNYSMIWRMYQRELTDSQISLRW